MLFFNFVSIDIRRRKCRPARPGTRRRGSRRARRVSIQQSGASGDASSRDRERDRWSPRTARRSISERLPCSRSNMPRNASTASSHFAGGRAHNSPKSAASRVTSEGRSAPRTIRARNARCAAGGILRGRRRAYLATCLLSPPRASSRGDRICAGSRRRPRPGAGARRGRRRRLKRAVPLFDERVRRVRGHVSRRLAPGGQRFEPLAADASVPCCAASAICFMAARDAGDGPRWRRGGPRRGLNGSGDRPRPPPPPGP